MFTHLRHQPPTSLNHPRELVLALPSLRSSVNLSRIVRLAGCCGIGRIITTGSMKVDPKIARDGAENVLIETRRSLGPILKKMKAEGFTLVGLEQTTNSQVLHEYPFSRKTVLVIGHERHGISDEILANLDAVVEIPVWGMPYSYNVATATTMAVYEYCRQFPSG